MFGFNSDFIPYLLQHSRYFIKCLGLNKIQSPCLHSKKKKKKKSHKFSTCVSQSVVFWLHPCWMLPDTVLRAALGCLRASRPGRRCWQGKEVLTFPRGLCSINSLYLAESFTFWLAYSLLPIPSQPSHTIINQHWGKWLPSSGNDSLTRLCTC